MRRAARLVWEKVPEDFAADIACRARSPQPVQYVGDMEPGRMKPADGLAR
ncbi:hypothetical protein [Streptomyces sp. NPDC048155]